jgi:acetylserotonin N-methyltransferase
MIFHDWPLAKCRELARRSFETLQPGGRIVLHEMFYNGSKTGPKSVAALSVSMLFGTEGEQYSVAELSSVLTEAGFVGIRAEPTFGYWGVLCAEKP